MSNVDEPTSQEPGANDPSAPPTAPDASDSPSHPVAPTVPMAHAPAPPPAPSGAFPPPPAAWPAAPPPPAPPARSARQSRPKVLTALACACFLTVSAFVGYTIGANHDSSSSSANTSSIVVPNTSGSQQPTTGQQGSGSSSSNGSIDADAVAAKVTPGVVNITTALSDGEAAGTGIVISSNGLVLTNNHVIAESTEVNVAIGGDDSNTHPAKVLGYDVSDDVALIQIQGVSDLQTAPLGTASSLTVGDPIVAIGNAGGKGGDPTVVTGSVTALNQQITASDQDGTNPETLNGLVQVDADIQPGDSGGPLVDANGKVVGMDSAASSSNGGFGFGRFSDGSGAEGYAIPIENALAIAKKIDSGSGGNNIHIGGSRALLGVQVQDDSAGSSAGGGLGGFGGDNSGSSSDNGSSGSGANVVGVQSGSGAAAAGIEQGDVIVGIDSNTVTSASELTHALVSYSPKDKVTVEWTDSSGGSHHASVVLGSGPPA